MFGYKVSLKAIAPGAQSPSGEVCIVQMAGCGRRGGSVVSWSFIGLTVGAYHVMVGRTGRSHGGRVVRR